MSLYVSIFAIVKPEIIYTLPEALRQIAALELAQADLCDSRNQERNVFTRIIQELTSETSQLKADKQQLARWLSAEQDRSIDKDRTITVLQQQNEQLRQQLADLQQKVEDGLRKEWQLKELQTMLFGQRSEKVIPETAATQAAIQQTLGSDFDAAQVEAIIQEAVAPMSTESVAKAILKTSRKRKRHQAHKGRRAIPTHIETEKVVFDLPGDKTGLKPMGKKVSVYYDFVPGKLIKKIEEHLQYISQDGETILCTPVLPRMIERGTVSNRLLAHLHSERFVYYMPYYRQLQRFERIMGFSFAASTVDHWEEVCYKKLKRLLKLLKKMIQRAGYIKADETSLKYLHDVGKGKAATGWLWVFLAPELKLILFEFDPTRAHQVPQEILKDFKGDLQVDGLSSYTAAFKDNDDVTLLGCLVHIRRGFQKAQKQNKSLAGEVLTYFNIIYKIEAYADKQKLNDEQRLALRKKYTKPFLDKIKTWLLEQQSKDPVPDTPMAKAITYALNQWDRVQRFTEVATVDLDNNSVERAIRPITLFRKNSLFASNAHGGERAALYYSLVESCKLNGIDPFEYLHDVYNRLHDCPAGELIHLLPPYWKPAPSSN
ncbi:IS66 family transposase [Flavitalea flava]